MSPTLNANPADCAASPITTFTIRVIGDTPAEGDTRWSALATLPFKKLTVP